MWPPMVVVGAVGSKYGPQVPLAEDQDAIGEFGSDGQNESFGEAVRSRTPRRDLDGVDPCAGQDGVERCGELAGSVADEEPKFGGAIIEVHQEVTGLLGGPCSGRMAGCAEDVYVAVADVKDEEDVDPFQGDGAVDVEEVHGQHGRGLGAREPSPRRIGGPEWCRRDPPRLEDPANRGCSDAAAELEKLALDALVAPGLVLPDIGLGAHV